MPATEPPAYDASVPDTLAAVDLGSNSFRMVIARVVGERLQLVDRMREGVRLAAYLDDDQRISPEGRRRALEALQKFGQRVRHLPPESVRAVGTNTLRKARNRSQVLEEAQEALGHPIEVVPGQEEARLIFLGAAHSLSLGGGARRLVVDIGGGSTECVIGEGYEPLRTESLFMGCVSHTLRHFPGGRLDADQMQSAVTAANLELRPMKADFRRLGWKHAVGCSGTVHAIHAIGLENGWSSQGITRDSLERLRRFLLEHDHVDELSLPGLRTDRKRVLPGGVAVLLAVFDSLGVERMHDSSGAMREGLLYDLFGRLRHEDARERTIQRFVEPFQVDVAQAERVERTALHVFEQVAQPWGIDPTVGRAFLSWAARLHEIGLGVAHTGFHKHGAYLVENSTMPGFSYQNQRLLALLLRCQRRKFKRKKFEKKLNKPQRRVARRLCRILRLAIVLQRSRSGVPLPPIRATATKKAMRLEFPEGWLEERALTAADLEQEAAYMRAAGYRLVIGTYGEP